MKKLFSRHSPTGRAPEEEFPKKRDSKKGQSKKSPRRYTAQSSLKWTGVQSTLLRCRFGLHPSFNVNKRCAVALSSFVQRTFYTDFLGKIVEKNNVKIFPRVVCACACVCMHRCKRQGNSCALQELTFYNNIKRAVGMALAQCFSRLQFHTRYIHVYTHKT